MARKAPRLLLCSLGLRTSQLTHEAEQALRSCQTLYCWDAESKGELASFLRSYCRDVRVARDQDEALDAVLAAARRRGGPVGVVRDGHASFLDGVTSRLLARCRARGLSYQVLDGVSSFDGIVRALGLELVGGGIQVCDAAGLAAGWPLDGRQPLLVFRPAAFLEPLTRRLKRHYPAGHRVYAVGCSIVSSEEDEVLELTLGGLLGKGGWIARKMATLALPALAKRRPRAYTKP